MMCVCSRSEMFLTATDSERNVNCSGICAGTSLTEAEDTQELGPSDSSCSRCRHPQTRSLAALLAASLFCREQRKEWLCVFFWSRITSMNPEHGVNVFVRHPEKSKHLKNDPTETLFSRLLHLEGFIYQKSPLMTL